MASGELSAYRAQDAHRTPKVRVGAIAARQCGRITWAQLRTLDIPPSTIRRWVTTGYLFRVLPHVYAVGHVAQDERDRLFELILFAGPKAALSHGTAAHHRGWLRYPVATTHISTPRRIRARLPQVSFHSDRSIEREQVDGIPCTTVIQTLLDLAATEPLKLVARALAQLDFERRLNPNAVRRACGRGRPGSAPLLSALDSYIPQLAHTKSELEDAFLTLCKRVGLPLPEVNVLVHGIEVDCYWRDAGLVVELDGGANHGTAAQRNRDQRRALQLRSRGIPVLRDTWDQVTSSRQAVAHDLRRQIDQCRYARSLS